MKNVLAKYPDIKILATGILVIGMTFVILARGIDLSVGLILGIAAVLLTGSMDSRGMIVAIPPGMGAAALAGPVKWRRRRSSNPVPYSDCASHRQRLRLSTDAVRAVRRGDQLQR
ncbi:MAG TPA: hypothetical protein VIJ63_07645 [Roseiarcus sp.]